MELVGVPASPGLAIGPVARQPDGATACVVVATELGPAEVASFAGGAVAGIATVGGGPLSHASILARSFGIPAVAGLPPDVLALPEGAVLLVDGDAGTVVVAPAAATVATAEARQRAVQAQRDEDRRRAADLAEMRDGQIFSVVANVGSVEDARMAVAEGADGVGMLRTEFAFLGRTTPPDEDEQYDAYAAIADALGDRPLVVRTLDLGADVPAWGGAVEPNPALGNRGLRFTLDRRELLDTQLRAITRLAADLPLGVMVPMVTTVDELDEARASLAQAEDASLATGAIPSLGVGITVEVPAAALIADAFAPRLDFFVIGTNDLTQYTLAADRTNARVAALADGLHPAVLRLIRQVTAAAEGRGQSVCVVGELGTDPAAIPILLGLGVTRLSVRPNAVGAVKRAVRSVAMAEARELAAAALAAESAAKVRALR